ncbi:MAG: hypothetical protein U9O18_00825, partial [Chloroflexota bacterium]|nr:hypothetical protein [Chloroflexota bacterium]
MFDSTVQMCPSAASFPGGAIAMFNLSAMTSTVSVDTVGRPREIRADGERLAVTTLESVRDETAAYPAESGPRTVFVVTASDRRYRLVHLLRTRR